MSQCSNCKNLILEPYTTYGINPMAVCRCGATNLHTLLTKHQIVHGLENDQAHIDAFVKELTEVMADVVPEKDTDVKDEGAGSRQFNDYNNGRNHGIDEMQSAIKLMGEK